MDFRGRGMDRRDTFRQQRSRPAQRRVFGRGRGASPQRSPAPPPTEEQYQSRLETQPQKKEALESIKSYETRKQDPAHRDVTIGQFFQEWTELLRANVVGELNDFEDNAITKYTNTLSGLDNVLLLDPGDRNEIKASVKAGMLLATAVRLLRTISASQKGKDIAMVRMLDEIGELEVPTFYNAILSNIGKFTDENFGNFRIQSPILEAKRRVIRCMATMRHYADQEYVQLTGSVDEMMNTIAGGQLTYVFQDADSVAYLKYKGRLAMKDVLKTRFYIKLGNGAQKLLISFPYFDIDKEFGIRTAADYLALLEKFTDTISGETDQKIQELRDSIVASILFQLAKDDFLEDVEMTIAQVFPYLADDKYKYFNTVTIRKLLAYVGVVYLGDFLNTRKLIANARVIYEHYLNHAHPYIKRNFKVSPLTNSEFGTAAQFIEKNFSSERGDRIEFNAISKFKDKALNVFGGVLGYYRKLSFKREIIGNLSTSEDAILNSFIEKDVKFISK